MECPNSFIADNSTPRERMVRLAVMGFMWDVSTPIALPLSAWLYNSGGDVRVMAVSLVLYVIACLLGLLRLWNFKEKKKSSSATIWGRTKLDEVINCSFLITELASPKHVIDSFRTTFKKRPGKKNIYLQCMLLVMLTYVMGVMAEKYCQFMYTKRMFQWGVDTYSYYDMIRTIVCNIGTFIIIPIFHFFNVNDNIIIMCSLSSTISSTLVRALAKTETIFLSSTLVGALGYIQSAPIRAQISRCVSPEELGKVFAMLASTESVVPIIASSVFTNLYNATSDLLYPWQATFYFVEASIMSLGAVRIR